MAISPAPPCPLSDSFADRPRWVRWEVTRACSLACQHCRAETQPKVHPDELTESEAFTLIDQLAELSPRLLVLTGGDPMIRRDILSIARHAHVAGIPVGLSPACTSKLMHFDFRAIREAGVERISLSIDGACRETHDAFRGERGTFARGLDAVKMAHHADIAVQINTTLTRGNMEEFDALHRLVLELKPQIWNLSVTVPNDQIPADQIPDPRKLESVFEELAEIGDKGPFLIRISEAPHFNRVLAQLEKPTSSAAGEPPLRAGIRDSRAGMFISHTGVVSPTSYLPFDCGNIRSRSPAEIYRENPLFISLRDSAALGGRCGRCEFRQICGGSRSRAFATSHDPFAEDPCCRHEPG